MLPLELSVLHALALDIALDHIFIGVLPYGVHVETTRPEMPSPEELFDCGVGLEDMFGCEAFYNLRYARGGEEWDALEEEVDVVAIRTDFDEPYLVALLDLLAHLCESMNDGFGKGFFPVFHGTDQMVEQESFVMALVDVMTHRQRLHLRGPTPHSECEVSRNEYHSSSPIVTRGITNIAIHANMIYNHHNPYFACIWQKSRLHRQKR